MMGCDASVVGGRRRGGDDVKGDWRGGWRGGCEIGIGSEDGDAGGEVDGTGKGEIEGEASGARRFGKGSEDVGEGRSKDVEAVGKRCTKAKEASSKGGEMDGVAIGRERTVHTSCAAGNVQLAQRVGGWRRGTGQCFRLAWSRPLFAWCQPRERVVNHADVVRGASDDNHHVKLGALWTRHPDVGNGDRCLECVWGVGG